MRPDLEDQLVKRHPRILSGAISDKGFCISDGWFSIVDTLCAGLQNLSDSEGHPQVRATGLAEEMGSLKFHAKGANATQVSLIRFAESLSSRTCSLCGAPGTTACRGGWYRTLCEKHAAQHPTPSTLQNVRVFVDMDDVLTDYRRAYLEARANHPEQQWPQSQRGFFADLAPLPGAIDGLNALRNMQGLDIHILTAPSVKNPPCYSEKRLWIERYLGFEMIHKLHISPHKGLFEGDILIDDNIAGKGQEAFKGHLIHFGSPDCPDWKAVINQVHHILSVIGQ